MTRIAEIGSKGKLSAEFDSPYDVFRVIDRLNWTPQRSKSSDSRGREGSFHTFDSLAEASDIFKNHPEKVREFSANDDSLERIDSPGKDVLFDITGDYLDIDRYLTGEPEMFGNAVMGNPKSIFATINILDSMVSYTNNEYQLVKQKRILRLVDWLETQGIRCQIISQSDSSVAFTSVVVKEFQDPFNLNDLAIACHPDWFRRVMFLVYEQSKTWSDGYGSAIDYDAKMLKYKPQPEDGLYIYVGGYMPYDNVKTLEEKFDELEKKIVDLIDSGMTYNDEPFTIGKKSGW